MRWLCAQVVRSGIILYVLESLLGLSFLVTDIVLVHLKVKVRGSFLLKMFQGKVTGVVRVLIRLKMLQGQSHWYCTRSS